MATLGTGNPTYADYASQLDPNGMIAQVIENLQLENEILQDATVVEGNLETGNKTVIRSGLPSVTWRKLNYGIQPSKSRYTPIQDVAGMLESRSEIDKELARLNGNVQKFRFNEDMGHVQSMSQTMATTLFYGDTDTDPEKFMGLSPRFNDENAENAQNLINGGGSGSDQTSIWLICWSPETCFMFYPKGTRGGLETNDLGEIDLFDSANGRYRGYSTMFQWRNGLCLRDWRYVVRICNVDNGTLTKTGSTGADLVDLMTQAIELLPSEKKGRVAFYCNRTVKSFLRRQISNRSNVNLTLDNVAGKHQMSFDGIPIRRCDSILNTESAVTFS